MSELQKLLNSILLPFVLVLILGVAVVLVAFVVSAVIDGADSSIVNPVIIQQVSSLFPHLIGMFSLLMLAGLVLRGFADASHGLSPRHLEPWIILILASTVLSQSGTGAALGLAAVIVARVVAEKWKAPSQEPDTPPAKSGE